MAGVCVWGWGIFLVVLFCFAFDIVCLYVVQANFRLTILSFPSTGVIGMHNQYLLLVWLLEQSPPPCSALPCSPSAWKQQAHTGLSPLLTPLLWHQTEAVSMAPTIPVHDLGTASGTLM